MRSTQPIQTIFIERVKHYIPEKENQEFLNLLQDKIQSYSESEINRFVKLIELNTLTDPLITVYHGSNQVKWNIYSLINILDLAEDFRNKEISHSLGSLKLIDIIKILGPERHYIAKELRHGSDNEATDEYGIIRDELDTLDQLLFEPISPDNGPWQRYFPEIKKRIIELYNRQILPRIRVVDIQEDDLAKVIRTVNASLLDDVLMTQHLLSVDGISYVARIPGKDVTTNSRDTMGNLDAINQIAIVYPYIDKKRGSLSIKQRLAKLDPLFHEILAIDPKINLNLFIKKLGELSYYLYRMLPLRHGTAAVVDWLIRGIAEFKGVELGIRNEKNSLPMDFEAFLTPNVNDYTEWFLRNAFLNFNLKEAKQPLANKDKKLNEFGFLSRSLSTIFMNKIEHTLQLEKYRKLVKEGLKTHLSDQQIDSMSLEILKIIYPQMAGLAKTFTWDNEYIDIIMDIQKKPEQFKKFFEFIATWDEEVYNEDLKKEIPKLDPAMMQKVFCSGFIEELSVVYTHDHFNLLLKQHDIPLNTFLTLSNSVITKILFNITPFKELLSTFSFEQLKTLNDSQWNSILTNKNFPEKEVILATLKPRTTGLKLM